MHTGNKGHIVQVKTTCTWQIGSGWGWVLLTGIFQEALRQSLLKKIETSLYGDGLFKSNENNVYKKVFLCFQ